MKVILTRNAGIRGQAYGAGTHLELADEDANTLIDLGKAKAEAPEVVKTKPAAGGKEKNGKKPKEEAEENEAGGEETGELEVKEADEQHPDEQ